DYWAIAIFVLGTGSISFAINVIATVLCLRGPGMTMRRLPLFTWINFINAFIVLAALPVLNAGLAMLLIDRQLEGHFFLPAHGGSAGLWSHIILAIGPSALLFPALTPFWIISVHIPLFFLYNFFSFTSAPPSPLSTIT